VVDNLVVAPNTLTQRMTGPTCSGSVCVDLSGMKDGDVAGLAAFNGDSGVLGVEKRGKKLVLVMSNQKSVIDNNKVVTGVEVDAKESVVLKQPKVYLRVDADFNAGKDIATFYYSLDGENWVSIGEKMKMRFDYRRFFMGTRFAIFNYATKQTGGHVDVESFNYKYE
jgi:beta-xylosidase